MGIVNVSLNPLYNLLATASIPAGIRRADVGTAPLSQNKTIYFLAIPADATAFYRNPVSTLIGLSHPSQTNTTAYTITVHDAQYQDKHTAEHGWLLTCV